MARSASAIGRKAARARSWRCLETAREDEREGRSIPGAAGPRVCCAGRRCRQAHHVAAGAIVGCLSLKSCIAMLFPTFEYALFFCFTLMLAWGALRHPANVHGVGARRASGHRLHKRSLLALSYIFYACWDWHFVPLLVALSLWAWLATRIIQHGRWRRASLALGICGCLGVLAYFKYSEFAVLNLVELAAILGWHPPIQPESPFLPLGISFMTFHAISLMMDAWRQKLDERVPLADALLYVSFFQIGFSRSPLSFRSAFRS